jgi:choline-sulfatase
MTNRLPRRPNILHILSDQHSPYVAGCYGDPVVQTPNLDRLAASGAVFDAAYCPSPICVPSRMSLLTGRHPYQNECWDNTHILDPGIPTFAHALGAAGYRTAIIGRMHSLGPDQLRGYSERLVGDHSPNFLGNPSPPRGVLDGTAGPARISLTRSGPGQGGYQVHDEYVTAAAVDWLNRLGIERRSLGTGEPFLLTVGYMLPHQPFVARRAEFERYRGRVPPPRHPRPPEPDHPYLQWWRRHTGIEDVTEDEIVRCRTAYWALVDRLDAMIGQVLQALEANGFADDTLVIYTTDHGEQAGEHGLWWKQTFYEASARVPLIIAWPGVIAPGQRCRRVVSALDVTATILDAAGAPALPRLAGRSLLGLIGPVEGPRSKDDNAASPPEVPASPSILRPSSEGANPSSVLRPSPKEWEDVAFSEFCVEAGWYQRMIRSGPWKLNYYHGHRPQLFNLADDPDEVRDLADDPGCARIREELTARVVAGWDVDAITRKIAEKRENHALLVQWARATHPRDAYRWHMPPELNYLDDT